MWWDLQDLCGISNGFPPFTDLPTTVTRKYRFLNFKGLTFLLLYRKVYLQKKLFLAQYGKVLYYQTGLEFLLYVNAAIALIRTYLMEKNFVLPIKRFWFSLLSNI